MPKHKPQNLNDETMRRKALARWENEGGAIFPASFTQSTATLEKSITEANIKALVDRFYSQVRCDALLGPIFNAVIGDLQEQWEPHLEKMYAFWSSVMLTSGRYHSNPMQKHKDLPPFDMQLFDHWLALFAKTAKEIYSPEIAERYISKSRIIAESLKLGIYYKRGDYHRHPREEMT